MIELENVSKTYTLGKGNEVNAVRDVSLQIAPAEFMLIIGRSGSGKTTLLNLAAGLTRPTSGTVRVAGEDLWQMNDRQQSNLRNQKIGFVFQFPSLLPTLTVYENVILPGMFNPDSDPKQKNNGKLGERAQQLIGQVNLTDKLEAYPRQLSAGQQQRVVIARSLINQPQILMADEPTSNLDEKTEAEIMELIHELHASLGITVVMVTHTRQLISYGTRYVVMSEGRFVNGNGNGAQ